MGKETLAGRASLDREVNLFRSRDSLTLLDSDARGTCTVQGYTASEDEG